MSSHMDIATLRESLLHHNSSLTQFSNRLIMMCRIKINVSETQSSKQQLNLIAMSMIRLIEQANALFSFFDSLDSYSLTAQHLHSRKEHFVENFSNSLDKFYMEKIIIPLQHIIVIMIEPDINITRILKDAMAIEDIYKKIKTLCSEKLGKTHENLPGIMQHPCIAA